MEIYPCTLIFINVGSVPFCLNKYTPAGGIAWSLMLRTLHPKTHSKYFLSLLHLFLTLAKFNFSDPGENDFHMRVRHFRRFFSKFLFIEIIRTFPKKFPTMINRIDETDKILLSIRS